MDLKKNNLKPSSVKELAVSTFAYVGGSIFGPLVLFLALGYFLDKIFETKPTMMIIGFFVAFITSNVLLFKKLAKINKLLESYKSTENKKEENKDQVS